MNQTKAGPLDGLDPGILPVAPLTRTFVVTTANGKRTSISRQQLPITPVYVFTDYRARAQALEYCVVNIGTPPSAQLAPFNEYVLRSAIPQPGEGTTFAFCAISTSDCSQDIRANTCEKKPKARPELAMGLPDQTRTPSAFDCTQEDICKVSGWLQPSQRQR